LQKRTLQGEGGMEDGKKLFEGAGKNFFPISGQGYCEADSGRKRKGASGLKKEKRAPCAAGTLGKRSLDIPIQQGETYSQKKSFLREAYH